MKLIDYHELHRRERHSWRPPDPLLPTALGLEIQSLLPAPGERFTGDLVTLDRGPLFDKVTRLCKWYLEASPEKRIALRAWANSDLAKQIAGFALRAAVVGAREQSADTVLAGLVAFAMIDIGRDVRDILVSLAVLFDCANRCGNRAATLFAQAAAVSSPAMSAVFLDYLHRTPSFQTLSAMGWKEVPTPDGVGYRSVKTMYCAWSICSA